MADKFCYMSTFKRICFCGTFAFTLLSVSQSQEKVFPIYESAAYSIFPDSVVQGGFKAVAQSATEISTNYKSDAHENKMSIASRWQLSADLSRYPRFHSSILLSDALYNLSLGELSHLLKDDLSFAAGQEWSQVWTRELANSAVLSLAIILPEEVKVNLLKRVKNGRILQDKGTGGGYPISNDRIIWALAAWEVYKVTGSKEWLSQSSEIIRKTIDEDRVNAYDTETGLMKGETSSLDSREQCYPSWMQPINIYESLSLGTNILHYQANRVLAMMESELQNKTLSLKYNSQAAALKKAINSQLWMYDKMAYSQYLYGRNYKTPSTRSGAIGQSLAVLYDVCPTELQPQIVQNAPVLSWGVPCMFPQKKNVPAYQNNAVWPFIQAYWALASAKVGNEASVLESFAAIYRPSALFLTNVENFDADKGDFATTKFNSGAMLNTISGNLALVYRILFGLDFTPNGMNLHPFVPKAMSGKRSLTNLKYRNAVLNIEVEGFGNEIKSFEIDGVLQKTATVSATLSGVHSIRMVLKNNDLSESQINKQDNYATLLAPNATFKGGRIVWDAIPGAYYYSVIQDGEEKETVAENFYPVKPTEYSEYKIVAIDSSNVLSYMSEPVIVASKNRVKVYQVEDFAPKSAIKAEGYLGKGVVEISKTVNRDIILPVKIEDTGLYYLYFRYANGNGAIESGEKCALRTLKIDGKFRGVFVFPQRGDGDWKSWGQSNFLRVPLSRGNHKIELSYEKENENSDGETNQALLDALYISRLK